MSHNIALKALVLLLIYPFCADANVYKCKVNGVVTFSQTPCGEDSETTEYKTEDTTPTPQSTAKPVAKADPSDSSGKESVDEYIEIRQIKRKISKLEWKKKDLIESRDKEIQALRENKAFANNNLAGSSYLQSLAQEMSAVANTYAMDIQSIDRELSELRTELRRLEN